MRRPTLAVRGAVRETGDAAWAATRWDGGVVSKGLDKKKEEKKKPEKSLKEKRAAKQEKKASKR